MPKFPGGPVAISKPFVFVACLIPALLLGWNSYTSQLGVDPVAQLEHTSGLWALRFLLITLAVTPLRMITKWNWLIRYRRMLGLFAFFYATLHLTIYLVIDLGGFWSQIFSEIARKPFITVGFAAWLLLIPLAATSTKAMMRKLGRNWLRLHRMIYVIGLLGVLHFLWQVKFGEKIAVIEPVIYFGIYVLLIVFRVPGWIKRLRQRRSLATPARSLRQPPPEPAP